MNQARLLMITLLLAIGVVAVSIPVYWFGSPCAQMVVTALAVFFSLRWFTCLRDPASLRRISKTELLSYLLLWPGFDLPAFAREARTPAPTRGEWILALSKAVLSMIVVWVGLRWFAQSVPLDDVLILGWAGMFSLVLLLHCSLFHLVALAWRERGREAKPIMDSPLQAKSLSEFWGRRWNLAFRDLAHALVYRPLVRRLGPVVAMLAVFLFSGVVHDLVISLPARGGWGLPTLYFMIQAVALLFARSTWGRAINLSGAKPGVALFSRIYTAIVLLLPMPLLFHRAYCQRVMIPLLNAIGAI